MAPDSWAESDGLPQHQSSLSQQDDSLDRQLLRHLMRRYGRDGVAQLMDEEAGSPIRECSISSDSTTVVDAHKMSR